MRSELCYVFWRTQFRDGSEHLYFENLFLHIEEQIDSIELKIIKCLTPKIYSGYYFNLKQFYGKSHQAIRLFHVLEKFRGVVYGGEYLKGDWRFECGCGRKLFVRNLKAHLWSKHHRTWDNGKL